jgi:hypothetical protein
MFRMDLHFNRPFFLNPRTKKVNRYNIYIIHSAKRSQPITVKRNIAVALFVKHTYRYMYIVHVYNVDYILCMYTIHAYLDIKNTKGREKTKIKFSQ